MDFVIHLLTSVALGFAAGFGAGYVSEKIAKLVWIIVSVVVLGVGCAVLAGYIDPDWFSLIKIPEFSLPNPSGFNVVVDLFLSHLPFGIAAVLGFFYGLGLRRK
jgi:uncharacterized membrane protein (Fun14 family)